MAFIFYYGSIVILSICFIWLSDKKRLKELLVLGLVVAVENYTLEVIFLHRGYYSYIYDSPGYPEVMILSSLIIFPVLGMFYYQYLGKGFLRNILLTAGFVAFNMVSEVISLKLNLFVYQKGLNLMIVFFMYLIVYLLIMAYYYLAGKWRRT